MRLDNNSVVSVSWLRTRRSHHRHAWHSYPPLIGVFVSKSLTNQPCDSTQSIAVLFLYPRSVQFLLSNIPLDEVSHVKTIRTVRLLVGGPSADGKERMLQRRRRRSLTYLVSFGQSWSTIVGIALTTTRVEGLISQPTINDGFGNSIYLFRVNEEERGYDNGLYLTSCYKTVLMPAVIVV
jgi:hypothetical protein